MSSTTQIDGNDLIITRHIAAPPARIWAALTEAEQLKQWFVPRPWQLAEAVVEARPGGRFLTVMQGPNGEGGEPGEGCVLMAEPDRILVWTDALAGGWRPKEAPFMTAIITLEAAPDGTTYTARVLHRDQAARERHEAMGFAQGWGSALPQLAELVEG